MTNPRDKRALISKINASPLGLQNLLGNVNQGVNPHELDHKVSPGIDMLPFWAINKLAMASDSTTGTLSAGISINVVVPEGELWQIVAAGGTTEAPNLAEYDLSIRILAPQWDSAADQREFNLPIFQNSNTLQKAVGYLAVGGILSERLILPGGWRIAFTIDALQATTAAQRWINVLYLKIAE